MKNSMKKTVCLMLALCLMLTGCTAARQTAASETTSQTMENQTVEASTEAETTTVVEEPGETEEAESVEAAAETSETSTQENTAELEAAAKETETSTKDDTAESEEAAVEGTTQSEETAAKETETSTEADVAEESTEASKDISKNKDSENAETKESIEEKKEPLVYTKPVPALESPKTLYSVGTVNVRKGPGTEYEVIDKLSFNESIEATGLTENGWYQYMAGTQSCFVSGNYLSETRIEPKPAPQPVPEPVSTPTADSSSGSATEGGVIMIGDSRCVQMQTAVGGGGCAWICENSKGYKWLNETAIGIADPSVGQGTKVVICLGVNDPDHMNDYAQLVNAKAAEWAGRGASVYYVSVNPVWENPYVTQEEVDIFNSTMPSLLSGVTWIDTQSWLIENGYRLVDGVHYDDATSVNIFNLIMGSI